MENKLKSPGPFNVSNSGQKQLELIVFDCVVAAISVFI